MNHQHSPSESKKWSLPLTVGFAIFAGIAAFYLWTEHRAHLYGILPWLFLAACPLMHIFMHRGHGGLGQRGGGEDHRHGGGPGKS